MKRNSIIKKLYLGKNPLYASVPYSKKYERLLEEAIKYEKLMRSSLEKYPEILSLYEKTNEVIDDLNNQTVDEFYMEGFRFGVLLGMDIADVK